MAITTIYLDAGHGEGVTGARDPGAIGVTGLTEAEVTLDMVQRVGHLLRAQGFTTLGATLGQARDEENRYEAVAAANAAYAGLFLSLHCNAAASPDAHGVEAWYGGSAVSRAVAEAILRRIDAQLASGQGAWVGGRRYPLTSRGAKVGRFDVLTQTHMPAVLLELAFLSNRQEEAWLRDPHVREQLAQAIADGMADVVRGKGV